MVIRIGLIGKTNAGKTTLFNSMTLKAGEVSNYPFTTKAADTGVGQGILLPGGSLGEQFDQLGSQATHGSEHNRSGA